MRSLPGRGLLALAARVPVPPTPDCDVLSQTEIPSTADHLFWKERA